MLQQTQVDTVIPYFERFLAVCPTIAALAAADEEQVLRLWQGLGYYSRARRLQQTAQLLVRDYGGALPDSFAALRELPGFGPYTAAAVASIAFGEAVPVVDGNVLRVAARLWALEDDIAQPRTRDAVFARLLPPIADQPPGDFNQALMELGALVCRPRCPACLTCPLQPDCVAAATGRTEELPVKRPRKAVPHRLLAAGLVWRERRFAVVRRPVAGMLGGLWELPGGRVEEGEALPAAVARTVQAATGLAVAVGAPCGTIHHAYSHFSITQELYGCTVLGGDAGAVRWLAPAEIGSLPFTGAALKAFAAMGLADPG